MFKLKRPYSLKFIPLNLRSNIERILKCFIYLCVKVGSAFFSKTNLHGYRYDFGKLAGFKGFLRDCQVYIFWFL